MMWMWQFVRGVLYHYGLVMSSAVTNQHLLTKSSRPLPSMLIFFTAEAKRKAAAEAAAEKKAAAAAAADAKRAAAAEAAAKKKEAAAVAAEAKRVAAAEAAAKKKKEAETKRAAAQAQKSVQKAAPGATINLFGGFGGGGSKPAPAPAQVEAAKAAAATAPRGVPTISSWSQNRDGSISGFISGSPSFADGESVTTSPIKGEASDGEVVQTGSGSKYFLAPKAQKKSTTFSLFGGGGNDAKKVTPAPAPAKSAPAGPSPAALAAQARKEQQAKLAEERKAAAEARKAEGKTQLA